MSQTLIELAEFSSHQFAPFLPEDSQVNPTRYGAELAFWLCARLAAKHVFTSYPNSEDWGWFIEYIPPNSESEFAIHCSNVGDAKDRWALSLRRHPRKWFGRDLPPLVEAARLVDAVHQVLKEDPSVVDLVWHFNAAQGTEA